MTVASFAACAHCIEAAGLSARGAFHVEADDEVPRGPRGEAARTVILVGNTGSSFWPVFRGSPEFRDGLAHPLDRWSERVITGLARDLGGRAVFPFKGPPYYPFQQWARRAEPLSPSPLGMLIHPRYGLWHAYRGALIVDGHLAGLPDEAGAESPCLACVAQPCLTTCPVDAFSPAGFDADACAAHLSGPNTCVDEGCRARNACPAGKPFQYVREQHQFHLSAFLRARAGETGGGAR